MSNAAKVVATAKTARKRNRKRKRRVASSSESSSSSASEDNSSGPEDEKPATVKLKAQVSTRPAVSEDSSSSSESSESESESDLSSGEESDHQGDDVDMLGASTEKSSKKERILYSRSPSPIQTPVPSFLPTKPDGSVDTESEQQLKDRFRKFWMESVADAFQDDLVQIHKEPGMNKSRLAMLVDSLASGADIFTSGSSTETRGVNEIDVVMGNPPQ